MAGQRGRDILLKISDGNTPERYVTVAGIRSREFELSATSVDGTSSDSPDGWRELIASAGVKSARVKGSGLFKDAESDARMRSLFFAGQVANWQLVLPAFGVISGKFQIRALKWGGAHDAEATFSVDLESAGPLTFRAIT